MACKNGCFPKSNPPFKMFSNPSSDSYGKPSCSPSPVLGGLLPCNGKASRTSVGAFQTFAVQTDDLGILLKWRLWFSSSGVGLRLCISNKLPGAAKAAGWNWTLSRDCKDVEVAWLPPFHIFSSLPPPQGLHPSGPACCHSAFFFTFPPFKTVNMPLLLHFLTTVDASSFIQQTVIEPTLCTRHHTTCVPKRSPSTNETRLQAI